MQQIVPGLYLVEDRTASAAAPTPPQPQTAPDSNSNYPTFYRNRYIPHNVAMAVDPDGVTLIDTGLPGTVPVIESALRELGKSLHDVKRVIITHAHVDHMGSMQDIVELTGASLCCHEIEAPYVLGEKEQPLDRRPFKPAKEIDVMLHDGDRLDALGGLEVIHTPGHTPGHICLFQIRDKVLHASGLVRYKDDWFDLTPPQLSTSYPDLVRSMRRVAKYDFDILFPYQGEVLFDQAGAKYRRLVAQLEAVAEIFRPDVREALTVEI